MDDKVSEMESPPGGISEEELLAKLEEQNRILLQDKRVPILSPRQQGFDGRDRTESTTSVHSASSGSASAAADTSKALPLRHTSSVFSSLISTVFHAEGVDKAPIAKKDSLASTEPVDEYQVWGELLANWDDTMKRKPKVVQKLVREGIPSKVRGLAWQLLSGAKKLNLPCGYVELIERDSPCEKQIRRDLARTFPDHDFFKEKDSLGQEALFNVMKAYSLHDREVGYCQGSPFIVGLLLMQMPEEDAFGVLVQLMQDYRLRELFKPSMSELGVCLHQLDSLVQDHLLELYGHFQAQGLHCTMYASSWFLTLFASTLPLDMVFRIMDWFLLDGMEAIFRISIGLLQGSCEVLLNSDMEGMIKHLQYSLKSRYEDKTECEELFARAIDLKLSSKKLKKVGKDFQLQREKETEESVENRRLRNENQILTHRISILEEETQSLAQKLIEGQVTRAEEAEERFSLRREMASLRKQLVSLDGSRPTTPTSSDADMERLRNRVAQLQNDSTELTALRRREAEMATALASSQARIAELASQAVELCQLQLRESELSAQVGMLNEDVALLRQQLAEKNRQLAEMNGYIGCSEPDSPSANGDGSKGVKLQINGAEEEHDDC